MVAPRTSAELLELAFALKRERPERTAAQIHEIMLAAGEGAPGLRTLQTHLAAAGPQHCADGRSPGKVYGRFEAARATSCGPAMGCMARSWPARGAQGGLVGVHR